MRSASVSIKVFGAYVALTGIALLVVPVGGVLVAANVLRDLVFVIPATLLTSIGLIAVLE